MGIFKLGAVFRVSDYVRQAQVPGLGPEGGLITVGGQVSGVDERQLAARIGLDGDLREAFAFEGPYRTTSPYQIFGRPDGSFLALYSSPLFGPPTPVLLLHGADGVPIAAPVSLTDVPASYQRIHVEVAADGGYVVLLSTGSAGTPGPDLRLMRFDAAGAQIGASQVIEIGRPSYQEWSGGVAVAADGTVAFGHTREVIIHVAENGFTFSEYGASVSLVTTGGQRVQVNLQSPGYIELPSGANSSVNDASNTYPPQIAALDTGGFAVVYQVNMGSFSSRVPTKFVAFVDGAGNVTGGPAQLFTDDTNGEFRVEALPGGRVAVAWVRNGVDVMLGVVSLGAGGVVAFESAVVGRTVANAFDSGLRDLIVAGDGSLFVTFDDPVTRAPTTQRLVVGDDLGRVRTGTEAGQTMTGTVRNDWFDAEGGHDTIDGGRGNDRMHGGAGDDLLLGGAGRDTLDGGNGFDTADYAASAAAVRINLATNVNRGGTADRDVLISIERVVGSAFGDRIVGAVADEELVGGAGDDTLDGGGGNDRLFGGAGGDSLLGNAGDDRLEGGQGNDRLFGGNGRDSLFGGAGNDTVAGGPGANLLDGGEGRDRLVGGTANDTLFGGAGADTLIGGGGTDQASGGAGADVFVFAASGRLTVTDFETGLDRVDIGATSFADGAAALAAARSFAGGVRISDGAAVMILQGVVLGDLTAGHFVDLL